MATGDPGSVEVRGLTWQPAGRRTPVLRDLDLSIAHGERVLLAGPSGAGKSTLLRAIAGLLLTADVGDLDGDVRVGGAPRSSAPGRVGMLLQDPTAAVVAERVGRDVAFGPENLAQPRDTIRRRVREALASVAFPYDTEHLTSALSGGESQRLALAGALALSPDVLLLDEPTSMLDPGAGDDVRRSILAAVEAHGSTLVVVEHRLEPWLEHVDRLVVLDETGQIVADGGPRAVLDRHGPALADGGVWVPGIAAPVPETVPSELVRPRLHGPVDGTPTVRAEGVVVRRKPRLLARRACETLALDGVDAQLHAGRTLAITGHSGSGKSTLLNVLAGLDRPDQGVVECGPTLQSDGDRRPWRWPSVVLAERLAWVPQQAEHGIVARTVGDEVLAASLALGRPVEEARQRAFALLDVLGLGSLTGASPYHLSGGEQRRLMLAAAVAHGPAGLLLDEPTVGQDRRTWAVVVGLCRSAADAGTATAMVTHDTTAVDAVADRTLTLAAGRCA